MVIRSRRAAEHPTQWMNLDTYRTRTPVDGRTGPDTAKRPLTGIRAGQGPFTHVVAGQGFEPWKLSRRIYSPLPLATRATCRGARTTLPSHRA